MLALLEQLWRRPGDDSRILGGTGNVTLELDTCHEDVRKGYSTTDNQKVPFVKTSWLSIMSSCSGVGNENEYLRRIVHEVREFLCSLLLCVHSSTHALCLWTHYWFFINIDALVGLMNIHLSIILNPGFGVSCPFGWCYREFQVQDSLVKSNQMGSSIGSPLQALSWNFSIFGFFWGGVNNIIFFILLDSCLYLQAKKSL